MEVVGKKKTTTKICQAKLRIEYLTLVNHNTEKTIMFNSFSIYTPFIST